MAEHGDPPARGPPAGELLLTRPQVVVKLVAVGDHGLVVDLGERQRACLCRRRVTVRAP